MMDRSLARFVYLLVAAASVIIIVLGIQSSAYIINSILLAAIITIAVLPIPRRLIDRGWNPNLSLIATLLMVVVVLALILLLAWISVGHMSAALAGVRGEAFGGTMGVDQTQPQAMLDRIRGLASDPNASQLLLTVTAFAGQFIGQAVTVLMILIFMLSAVVTTPVAKQLADIDGAVGLNRFVDLTQDVQKYVSITTIINALVGLLNALFLWIVGVDFAVFWGILTWIAGYIPIIGFWIALIPPVLLAWTQFGLPTAAMVAVVFVILNGTAEDLVKPRMMGESLNVSPLVVFVSLVFWGWVLGPVGAILAVPLTLMVLSVLRSFEATRWVAVLAATAPVEEGERSVAFQRFRDLRSRASAAVRRRNKEKVDEE